MLFNGRGSTPSYGCSSVIRHPENVDSRPCRSAPRGKGPRRARAQTRSSNVASGAATSSTSRAIKDRCESLSQLKHSMSNRRLKFEPTSAARRAVTSPSLNITSTPACSERCRAASIALGTTSTPTTCQPRSANLTDHRPVPHPRSSADPRGSSRVSSTSASSWSNSGIIDAASDSHGVKPILYANRYQRLTMPPYAVHIPRFGEKANARPLRCDQSARPAVAVCTYAAAESGPPLVRPRSKSDRLQLHNQYGVSRSLKQLEG
jgi:hypothetical protein